MFLFTNYVPDPEVQYLIGFSMVAVISINIGVNLMIVFNIAAKSLPLIYKRYRIMIPYLVVKKYHSFLAYIRPKIRRLKMKLDLIHEELDFELDSEPQRQRWKT